MEIIVRLLLHNKFQSNLLAVVHKLNVRVTLCTDRLQLPPFCCLDLLECDSDSSSFSRHIIVKMLRGWCGKEAAELFLFIKTNNTMLVDENMAVQSQDIGICEINTHPDIIGF